MSEKTYDAIYKIAKNAESNNVVLWVGPVEISGQLIDCSNSKCISDIITLEGATSKCPFGMNGEIKEKHFAWLNIPACKIDAFTLTCCLQNQ